MKQTASIFKALADETRLRILALLTEGELCVCDLMAILDLPQSTVSRHLAYLRNAGLVENRRRGVWMFYRLAEKDGAFFLDLLNLLEKHLPNQPRSGEDRLALVKFQAEKKDGACG